jgi:hypothetical protein
MEPTRFVDRDPRGIPHGRVHRRGSAPSQRTRPARRLLDDHLRRVSRLVFSGAGHRNLDHLARALDTQDPQHETWYKCPRRSGLQPLARRARLLGLAPSEPTAQPLRHCGAARWDLPGGGAIPQWTDPAVHPERQCPHRICGRRGNQQLLRGDGRYAGGRQYGQRQGQRGGGADLVL